MKNIIIYTTPSCHFCHLAKDFFNENKIPFTEKDASTDMETRKEAISKSNQMGVPVIDIEGTIIVGFNQPIIRQALGI